MAFRLAARFSGGPRAVRWGAGVLAAVALLLTPLWVRYMAHGNEAPMAIFFLLWGIERHLDGKRNHALILGFLACLLRPEVAPFIGAYGAYLFWKVPELRKLAVGLGAGAAGGLAGARVDRLGQPAGRRAEGHRRAALEPVAARQAVAGGAGARARPARPWRSRSV